MRIPRRLKLLNGFKFEIHGFPGASKKAHVVVVCVKVGENVKLLTAKTKLVLCAANLLSKLLQKVSGVIVRKLSLYAWSDSTFILSLT